MSTHDDDKRRRATRTSRSTPPTPLVPPPRGPSLRIAKELREAEEREAAVRAEAEAARAAEETRVQAEQARAQAEEAARQAAVEDAERARAAAEAERLAAQRARAPLDRSDTASPTRSQIDRGSGRPTHEAPGPSDGTSEGPAPRGPTRVGGGPTTEPDATRPDLAAAPSEPWAALPAQTTSQLWSPAPAAGTDEPWSPGLAAWSDDAPPASRLLALAGHVDADASRPPVNPARAKTDVGAPFPMPQATEPERKSFRLRRSESVIAEVEAKRPLAWAKAVASQAAVLARRGAAASVLGARALRAGAAPLVGRFEALPRKKQVLYVAAPWAVILALGVTLAIAAKSDAPVEVPAKVTKVTVQRGLDPRFAPPTGVAADDAANDGEAAKVEPAAPEAAVDVLRARAGAGTTEVARDPSAAGDPTPTPPSTTVAAAAEVPSEWRTLPVDSALRAKADPTAAKVVKLPAGTKVLVYPTFPAPEGWMLAAGPEGEIGYLKRGVFSATPAPATPKKSTTSKSTTKARATPKKSSKVDPFELLERPRSR